MAELVAFLKLNEGKHVTLVTSSGVFNGKIVAIFPNTLELSDVAEGFTGIGQHAKNLTIILDSITAWGNSN